LTDVRPLRDWHVRTWQILFSIQKPRVMRLA
jgi:hypothetical protein